MLDFIRDAQQNNTNGIQNNRLDLRSLRCSVAENLHRPYQTFRLHFCYFVSKHKISCMYHHISLKLLKHALQVHSIHRMRRVYMISFTESRRNGIAPSIFANATRPLLALQFLIFYGIKILHMWNRLMPKDLFQETLLFKVLFHTYFKKACSLPCSSWSLGNLSIKMYPAQGIHHLLSFSFSWTWYILTGTSKCPL